MRSRLGKVFKKFAQEDIRLCFLVGVECRQWCSLWSPCSINPHIPKDKSQNSSSRNCFFFGLEQVVDCLLECLPPLQTGNGDSRPNRGGNHAQGFYCIPVLYFSLGITDCGVDHWSPCAASYVALLGSQRSQFNGGRSLRRGGAAFLLPVLGSNGCSSRRYSVSYQDERM